MTIEDAAALLGLVNVILVVRRSIWNYPFAIVSVILYAQVFREAGFYSDAALQLFFLVLNIWGWWNWAHNQAAAGELVVERLAPRPLALGALGLAATILLWGAAERRWLPGATYPFGDAAIAAASIVAQALQSARRLESWALWIAVDTLSVGLYQARGLEKTTALYAVFLCLALWGLVDWTGVWRRQAGGSPP